MKKYIVLIICFLTMMLSCTSANASTSSALATSTYASGLASYFGDEYETPYGINTSGTDVDDETGAVTTREIDLNLQGKNGLDFKVIRSHNSQQSDDKLVYRGQEVISVMPFYVYTYNCEENNKSILVHIPYESDVEEYLAFRTTTDKMDKKEEEEANDGTVYYSGIPASATSNDEKYYPRTIRTYDLDKDVKPILLYRDVTHMIEWVSNTRIGDFISRDTLWRIDYKPKLIMELKAADDEMIYGYFRTEDGAVYPVEVGYRKISQSEATASRPKGMYLTFFRSDSDEFQLSIDSEIASGDCHYLDTAHIVRHEKGFSYLFKIISRDGKQYFFKSNSDNITGSTRYEIQAVIDRYGNMIDYANMTDSMGRKIEASSTSIKVKAGGLTQEVQYVTSGPVSSSDDPNDYYTFDDEYSLSVYKTEYSNQNVLSSNNVTQYQMVKNQLVFEKYNSYSSQIKKVIYPTGGEKRFSYVNKKNSFSLKDPQFANISVVSQVYDYDGSKSNITDYSYVRTGCIMDSLTKTNSSTGVTSKYTFDDYGRTEKLITSGKDKSTILYTYKNDSYNKTLSKVKVTDGMTQTTEYGYNKYNEITSTNDGYVKNTSTYDNTYSLVLKASNRQMNSAKGTVTENTLTSDGKNIAKSDVYEVTYSSTTSSTEKERALKSTTVYTYDDYGNVSSVKINDGTKDIITNYLYTYNSDGSYKVKQWVDGVADADGSTRSVVTVTQYDPLGRCVSVTDANKNTTTTEYTNNSTGALIKTTAPDGGVSSVSSDIKNNTIIEEKPNGTKTKYIYTKLGNLSKVYVTNDSGQWILSAQRTYDSAMRSSSEYVYKDYNGTTAADYIKTVYTYVTMPDSRVQKVKSTDKSGKTIQEISYEYAKNATMGGADIFLDYFMLLIQDYVCTLPGSYSQVTA